MDTIENKQVIEQKVLELNSLSNTEGNQTEQEAEETRQKLKKSAKNYIRVGDNYYKIVYRPDKKKNLYKDYLKLNKSTITDDHTHGIIKYISKYDDFCMVASHTDYRQVINGFYNEYSELTHKPKPTRTFQ